MAVSRCLDRHATFLWPPPLACEQWQFSGHFEFLFFPRIGCHFSGLGLLNIGYQFSFDSSLIGSGFKTRSRHIPIRNLCEYPPPLGGVIDQALGKMAGYWPSSFLYGPINDKHAKKNKANNQPSWPHAWSITNLLYGKVFNRWNSGISWRKPLHLFSNWFIWFLLSAVASD